MFKIFNRQTKPNIEVNYMADIDPQKAEKAFARLFTTDDGKTVLTYLQNMTFARVLGADSSSELLRYKEGQRAVVATIQRLINRGNGNSI